MDEAAAGKKVFFLYPPSVIRDELITQLIEQEFEVYILNDHALAIRVLRLFPTSIVYINLDANLGESEWEEWIRNTMADPLTSTVGIGIVSYNADEDLQRKYLMDIGLRASCTADKMSSVNIKDAGKQITGNINDISVVGFSCTFVNDPLFKKNTILHDVQLKLRGALLRVEAIVFGTRTSDDGIVYVMLFTQNIEPSSRKKIRAYLQVALQAELEVQIKSGTLSA